MVLTLFSSFGQTFLISLFVPEILNDFSLTKAQFGTLYSAATLISAGCLPYCGKWIDRIALRRFTLFVAVAMIVSCEVVAVASSFWVLLLGLVGLRLTGQGLLGFTASTTMARTFSDLRGKAVSLAGLGFPIGEALFPLVVASLIQWAGWRIGWHAIAAFIGISLIPLIFKLLEGMEASSAPNAGETTGSPEDDSWSRRQVMQDPRFYLMLPSSMILPFILTGTFLYQIPLAESKGWAPTWMASGLIGFAVARLVFSLGIGPIIDKKGAVRIYPFYLLPLGIGLLGMTWATTPWMAPTYLFLAGISQGAGGSIKSALWAELYGIEQLGAIKSMISTLMIFSTAASPVLFGWLLDLGIPFPQILTTLALLVGLTSILSLRVCYPNLILNATSPKDAVP